MAFYRIPPQYVILNRGYSDYATITETTLTLKQEVYVYDLEKIQYVGGVHVIAENPSGSGCVLYIEVRALTDKGDEFVIYSNTLTEGSSIDEWITNIYDYVQEGYRIVSIRLYGACNTTPATGYEPKAKIFDVIGIK